MSLDVSKLECLQHRGRKTIARCPACAETEHDNAGKHLAVYEDGSFGCVLYPGDSPDAKAHRKRIFALCGDYKIRPLIVKSKKIAYEPSMGQNASYASYRPKQHKQTGVLNVLVRTLGRLGRQNTHTRAIGNLVSGSVPGLKERLELPATRASDVLAVLSLREIRQVFPNARIRLKELKLPPQGAA
jgi:hypothetical protein